MADPHSTILDALSPPRSNVLHFHAVFGEFWPNNRLVLLFRVGGPCLRNSGSAAEMCTFVTGIIDANN